MTEKVIIFEYVPTYMELTIHELEKIKFDGWEHLNQGLYKKVIPEKQSWIPIKSLLK